MYCPAKKHPYINHADSVTQECITYIELTPAPSKAKGNFFSDSISRRVGLRIFICQVFTKGYIKMLVKSFPFETISKQ